MNNAKFIKEYGIMEFREICNTIYQELAIAKMKKQIGKYRINNTKKCVKFYNKEQKSVSLDFALIFTIGINNIRGYLERLYEKC